MIVSVYISRSDYAKTLSPFLVALMDHKKKGLFGVFFYSDIHILLPNLFTIKPNTKPP